MAVWQIMKKGLPTKDPNFDDGKTAVPGDADFSTDEIKAHIDGMGGKADGFNYVGLSHPQPAEPGQ